MINGGLAAKNSFRKKNAVNAIQTKYPTTVVTAEEVAERDRLREADNLDMESEEEVVVQAKSKKSSLRGIFRSGLPRLNELHHFTRRVFEKVNVQGVK